MKRKLKLNRETILRLDLRSVRGGDEIPPGTFGCTNDCQSARCPIPGSVGCISDACTGGGTSVGNPSQWPNCNPRTQSADITCY
jgi:hypothetical protein